MGPRTQPRAGGSSWSTGAHSVQRRWLWAPGDRGNGLPTRPSCPSLITVSVCGSRSGMACASDLQLKNKKGSPIAFRCLWPLCFPPNPMTSKSEPQSSLPGLGPPDPATVRGRCIRALQSPGPVLTSWVTMGQSPNLSVFS